MFFPDDKLRSIASSIGKFDRAFPLAAAAKSLINSMGPASTLYALGKISTSS